MKSELWLLCFVPAFALAQTSTPNTSYEVPAQHRFLVEAELSAFDANAFNRYGTRVEIPGQLRFVTNTLRLSYAPYRSVAAGAEVTYRVVDYRADLSDHVRNSGLAGAGLFVDYAHHPLGLDATARAGFFRSRPERDPVLTPSDGLDRWSVAYAAGRRTAFGRFEFVYGAKAYFFGSLQLAAGRTVARDVDALIVASYRRTSESHEEGTFFENEGGYGGAAGVMLQWQRARLSVTRTLRMKNGLDGVRVALSVRVTGCMPSRWCARSPSAVRESR